MNNVQPTNQGPDDIESYLQTKVDTNAIDNCQSLMDDLKHVYLWIEQMPTVGSPLADRIKGFKVDYRKIKSSRNKNIEAIEHCIDKGHKLLEDEKAMNSGESLKASATWKIDELKENVKVKELAKDELNMASELYSKAESEWQDTSYAMATNFYQQMLMRCERCVKIVDDFEQQEKKKMQIAAEQLTNDMKQVSMVISNALNLACLKFEFDAALSTLKKELPDIQSRSMFADEYGNLMKSVDAAENDIGSCNRLWKAVEGLTMLKIEDSVSGKSANAKVAKRRKVNGIVVCYRRGKAEVEDEYSWKDVFTNKDDILLAICRRVAKDKKIAVDANDLLEGAELIAKANIGNSDKLKSFLNRIEKLKSGRSARDTHSK